MSKELVLRALKRYRRISGMARYGGLGPDYKLAQEALEATESIQFIPFRQLGLGLQIEETSNDRAEED